jgi:hypothetical protein
VARANPHHLDELRYPSGGDSGEMVRHRVNAHKSISAASNVNETQNRQQHKDNADDSENYRNAETETPWRRLGKPKLRQLHAGSGENVLHEIWNNQTHDQAENQKYKCCLHGDDA